RRYRTEGRRRDLDRDRPSVRKRAVGRGEAADHHKLDFRVGSRRVGRRENPIRGTRGRADVPVEQTREASFARGTCRGQPDFEFGLSVEAGPGPREGEARDRGWSTDENRGDIG